MIPFAFGLLLGCLLWPILYAAAFWCAETLCFAWDWGLITHKKLGMFFRNFRKPPPSRETWLKSFPRVVVGKPAKHDSTTILTLSEVTKRRLDS